MQLPVLDSRLQAALDFYPSCPLGADIGSDHGRLPLHLLTSGRCQKMVVSDISAPALQKAVDLLTLHGCQERAIFSLSDGLNALREPAQAISILGMGGDTIRHILSSKQENLCGATLILSPHTELSSVRFLLPSLSYRIAQEKIARAGGRFYVILQAIPGSAAYSEKELYLGPRLLAERPEHFSEYLAWRFQMEGMALKALTAAGGNQYRMEELSRYLRYIKEETE